MQRGCLRASASLNVGPWALLASPLSPCSRGWPLSGYSRSQNEGGGLPRPTCRKAYISLQRWYCLPLTQRTNLHKHINACQGGELMINKQFTTGMQCSHWKIRLWAFKANFSKEETGTVRTKYLHVGSGVYGENKGIPWPISALKKCREKQITLENSQAHRV